ncbi:hypothetical protein BpHYR1_053312 [Brachionus plicatilis]|uniref:Uncharacterized protein n=1 Tax=Brachionus plicatilis TaxID=10195 RepID=A0A3M7T455_BRAPC|nr:hypothetical protein BpHYR1_053312 [Brachionus plicatilis]
MQFSCVTQSSSSSSQDSTVHECAQMLHLLEQAKHNKKLRLSQLLKPNSLHCSIRTRSQTNHNNTT